MLRVHTTNEPKLDLTHEYKQTAPDPMFPGNKPKGLFYARGMQWHDWASEEMPHKTGVMAHVLDVDPSRILTLHSPAEAMEFHRKYAHPQHPHMVDWSKVAEDYDGLEIPHLKRFDPYFKTHGVESKWEPGKRYAPTWYDGWQVDGGTVWRPSAIKRHHTLPTADLQKRLAAQGGDQ